MGYNQHQSFFLRDRWLGKGLRSIADKPSFFFEQDAFEKIGLGKNMVQSLRHWIVAVGAAEAEGTGKNRTHEFTTLGKWILENDPAIKYFDTAAILHHSLIFENEPSTTWYWFFNIFSESISTREDIFIELNAWVQEKEKRVISENSIKRDIDCLIRMYTADGDPNDPEEVTSSPLKKLGLLREENGLIYKEESKIPKGSNQFFKYILLKYRKENDQGEISLEDILNKEGMIGKAFNLGRTTIVGMLMEIMKDPNFPIRFTQTNNLDMVLIPDINPDYFLEKFFV